MIRAVKIFNYKLKGSGRLQRNCFPASIQFSNLDRTNVIREVKTNGAVLKFHPAPRDERCVRINKRDRKKGINRLKTSFVGT